LLLDNDVAIVLYSLTKYSAIFAEVKGYFGKKIWVQQENALCTIHPWSLDWVEKLF
jgi:hypothetical protein